MGKVGSNFLQGVRSLFGKSTANQTPLNLDLIHFNSATQEWELVSGVIGTGVQSSSNVGSGEGVAKARIGNDLPFRSLTTTSKISLTGSANEIEIDIGTLLISDISGLQTALDNLEPPFLISDITGLQTALDSKLESPIAISDTTGLQTALDSKIETLTNVGTGIGIAKAKVLQNVDLKSILAGANITINSLTNEIEIVATGGGAFDILTDDTLGADSDTFDSSVFSAREFLLVLIHLESVGGALDTHMRFNDDSGVKYAYQRETNFSSNSTFVNQDHYEFDIGTPLNDFAIIWIDNPDGKNKLIRQMQQGDPSTSVGTAPQVGSIGGKFVETAQLTKINLLNTGVGDYLGGKCRMIVMGSKT